MLHSNECSSVTCKNMAPLVVAMSSERPLIIHTEHSRGWGGQEIRVLEELCGMRRLGYDVALVSPRQSEIYKRAEAETIQVYAIDFGIKTSLLSSWKLFRLFSQLKPSVVNTHSSDDSWLAGLVAKVLRVPLIIRTRHISVPISSTFSYRYFPHLILTTSKAIREDIIKLGIDDRKIISVPTGIDTDRFKYSPEKRETIRQAYGISAQDIVIGNMCVFRSWKGLDFFVDTAAVMNAPFKFMLVGDGPHYERLKKKVQSIGLEKSVIFTGYQEHVEEFCSALDIFFFTSYAGEGVSQALLQALCLGMPLVSCDIPPAVETLDGFDDYILVQYGDTTAAKKAIGEMTENIKNVESRVAARSELFHSRHSIESMLGKLVVCYKRYGIIKNHIKVKPGNIISGQL